MLLQQRDALERAAAEAWEWLAPYLLEQVDWFDSRVAHFRPWQLAAVTAVSVWVVAGLSYRLHDWAREVYYHGLVQSILDGIKGLPIICGYVSRAKENMKVKIRESVKVDKSQAMLPAEGQPVKDVVRSLEEKARGDVAFKDGYGRVSGAVYMAGDEHRELMNTAYAMFSQTNPLHTSVFPSVASMEREVVAMTASLLGGGPEGVEAVCGTMTSGGTESILTAMKATRDYMRAMRGIRRPEMIVAVSAHSAYFKAAEYFNIRIVKVPVGEDYRLSARAVARHINANTIVVVASAPNFPHGVVDHVADIARVTARRGVCLHVDACLGGFVLPFARELGYPVPPFDFSVAGVTSMSVDTHKFGLAQKGTSVVLYRSPDMRRHQYTRVTDWSGGLYISPGFAGSRSGALIATAWASLIHNGRSGFLEHTRKIMKAAKEFEEGVQRIEGLALVGRHDMCVIAFTSKERGLNIYSVNDAMTRRGWHLSTLQLPPALHVCFTLQHTDTVPQLLKELAEAVEEVRKEPGLSRVGTAPIYGMSAVSPDRAIIGDFLEAYQDVLLSG